MNSRSGSEGPHRRAGGRDTPRGSDARSRSLTATSGGDLPKWVREEILRSTPKERREPALQQLSKAITNYADERYPAALADLRRAKDLAPRSSTIRELLGLSAYFSERWEEALRELRTFRRISGDIVHMPVEMDCQRALGRTGDVEKTWRLLQELDVSRTVSDEARVVYASFLLDQGDPRGAWTVIRPGRLIAEPTPGDLRRWFVAARVALAVGDRDAADRIVSALEAHEVDFEGVDDLRAQLG